MRRFGFGLLLALALSASSASADADVLVLRDGNRLETRGAWEIRGSSVVFTDHRGTLTSIRLEEVDLEASRAPAEPESPDPDPAEDSPRRQATLVLTDKDVPSARPVAPVTEAAAGEDSGSAADPASESLVVERWEEVEGEGGDGIVVAGTLTNRSESVMSDVRLGVEIYGFEGERLGEGEAFLQRSILAGGGSTGFRIPFPGVFGLERVEFDISGIEYMLGVASIPEAGGDDAGGSR